MEFLNGLLKLFPVHKKENQQEYAWEKVLTNPSSHTKWLFTTEVICNPRHKADVYVCVEDYMFLSQLVFHK